MKACPKLFTFFLRKQLKNIPTAMPNHVLALGQKTAMQIQQALMVILEGELLTGSLLYILCYYLQWGAILNHEKCAVLVPMQRIYVITVFVFSDAAQDLVATRLGE